MLEGFLWLSTQERYAAYCLTFAQGLSETELLRRFGGDLSSARWACFGDEATVELERFGDVIQVGQCDGWAFAYEWGEWRGADPENLSAVSAETVVVSVCYASAITVFCYMEDGITIAYFDPLFPPYADATPRVLALLHQAGLFQEDTENDRNYDYVSAMFALAEAAGVRLSREALLEKPLLTSFIK